MKQDWKDDIFADKRKYKLINNADGTVFLNDVTQYEQQGDAFGAKELDEIGAEINRIQGASQASLSAAGWSSATPFTQSVSVAGVTANDVPIISLLVTDGTSASSVKTMSKAWACVDRAVTGTGNITFYCYNKKPAVDFAVQIKGV